MAGAIESICIGPMSEEALEELVERVVPVSLSVAKEDHLLWSGATRDFDVSIARESILDHLEARALPRELRFSLNVVFSYPRDHGGRAGRAAAGAPADLLARAHRAALEEIEHAERCFALAAGYGGRTRSVEPMPDLLLGGLGSRGDPRIVLAVESLNDGCLLEDFNADVAAECARACREPVTRDLLEQIAREERSHAELSWDVLAWTLSRWPAEVAPAVRKALARLDRVARPTAVSRDKAALVAAADPVKMREHGRISDEEWAALWNARVAATRARAEAMLEGALRAPRASLESAAGAPPA